MRKNSISAAAIVGAIVLFYACDMLEKDALPEPEQFAATEFVTFSGGAVVFNLADIVKPVSEAASEVVEQPKDGKLVVLGEQLFKYTPAAGAATDKVVFRTTFSGSTKERLDEITFRMEAPENARDSLDLPCTIIASDDFYEAKTDDPVEVDVLNNDYICPSLALPANPVTIVEPPSLGSVVVNARGFTFTPPQGEMSTVDSVLYQLCSGGAAPVCAMAVVYLQIGDAPVEDCDIKALPDYFYLVDSMHTGPDIEVDILANDQLCGLQLVPEIVLSPVNGSAVIDEQNRLVYSDFGSLESADSLRYIICDDADFCSETLVTIEREQ